MVAIRLGTFLLLAMLATAQQPSASKSAESRNPEPELPVIDYNACPFEGCVFREWIVTKRSTIYNNWREERKAMGELTEGEKVRGVTGVLVTRKPDRFLVTQPIPYLSLKAGDMILQYQPWREGYADLWVKGRWVRDFDWGATENGEVIHTEHAFTLPPVFKEKSVTLVERGVREWWVRVITADGTTGWVLEQGNLGNMNRYSASPTAKSGSKVPPARAAISEPKLPVIDYKACPGEDRIVPNSKIVRQARMYSSFQDKRTMIGTLNAGQKVTVLAGVSVIREPDRAVIRQPREDISLERGDVVLRYGDHADGNSDFWAKGAWFAEYYEEIVAKGGECGFAEKTNCTIAIVKNGVREWWVQVKTGTGRTGWVLASKSTGDKGWDSGNFGDLCRLD